MWHVGGIEGPTAQEVSMDEVAVIGVDLGGVLPCCNLPFDNMDDVIVLMIDIGDR